MMISHGESAVRREVITPHVVSQVRSLVIPGGAQRDPESRIRIAEERHSRGGILEYGTRQPFVFTRNDEDSGFRLAAAMPPWPE
jgi:hypothetical protein